MILAGFARAGSQNIELGDIGTTKTATPTNMIAEKMRTPSIAFVWFVIYVFRGLCKSWFTIQGSGRQQETQHSSS